MKKKGKWFCLFMVAVLISGDRRGSRTDGKSEDAIRSNGRRLRETFDSTVKNGFKQTRNIQPQVSVVNSTIQTSQTRIFEFLMGVESMTQN